VFLWTAVIVFLATSQAAADNGDDAGVGCGRSGCGANAYSAGSSGNATSSTNGGSGTNAGAGGRTTTESSFHTGSTSDPSANCGWKALPIVPVAGSPLWGGNDPSAGYVEYSNCLADPSAGALAGYRYVANARPGAPPPPSPPPTPEELAQQAYKQLPIPDPRMNFGPDGSQIAVNYWLYLWIDDPGPIKATATAGAVSVTATAKLSSVTWTMGEPISPDALNSAAAPITCQGTGVDPGPTVDTTAEPAGGTCAYLYKVRSTPERTGGSGTWPVTATANWTITWAATTGQAGALPAPPTVSTTQVRVGAWSTVMAADGASVPGG